DFVRTPIPVAAAWCGWLEAADEAIELLTEGGRRGLRGGTHDSRLCRSFRGAVQIYGDGDVSLIARGGRDGHGIENPSIDKIDSLVLERGEEERYGERGAHGIEETAGAY